MAAAFRDCRDGRALADIAELDTLELEREAAWKGVARRLEEARREIALLAARIQNGRARLAALRSRDDDEPAGPRERPELLLDNDESQRGRLLREFEEQQRRAEAQRVSLHEETERLRGRREALLGRLPPSVRATYRALSDAGRVPAIASASGDLCSGCEVHLPSPLLEQVRRGATAVCPCCERLLCLSSPVG